LSATLGGSHPVGARLRWGIFSHAPIDVVEEFDHPKNLLPTLSFDECGKKLDSSGWWPVSISSLVLVDPRELHIRMLIERVLNGSESDSVYHELFEVFEKKVEHGVREMLGNRFASLGEDAVIGIFSRAFRKLDSFRGDGRFESWLMRLSRNYCIDLLRSPAATSALILRSHFGPPGGEEHEFRRQDVEVDAHGASPFDMAVAREQIESIRSALLQLRDREYTVAVMVMKGFSNLEIAEHERCSVGAIERLRLRTLEKLETYLRKLERTPET
jgi:RNA polymerase sigma factor (sigma-70 family)